VHGANRLGGNGVANSTVFGGLAGASMAAHTNRATALPDPDCAVLERSLARAFEPLGNKRGDLGAIREKLYDVMWNEVGILRTADSLARGQAALDALWRDVGDSGVAASDRRYNLTWMDRLNLESLILVSRVICAAAIARTDSRGAHFREDFPATSDLATSRYTLTRLAGEAPMVDTAPVSFTRVRPGESLIEKAA
jgi:fumarate reductase flavoprotein subunit